MPYSSLPNELILEIAGNLDDPCDLKAYFSVDRRAYSLISPTFSNRLSDDLITPNGRPITISLIANNSKLHLGQALTAACSRGWIRLAKVLIRRGAALPPVRHATRSYTPQWYGPVLAAMLSGSIEIIELLLARDSKLGDGSRFFSVASRGLADVMLWLLGRTTAPSFEDTGEALKAGHMVKRRLEEYPHCFRVIAMLLEHGAYPGVYYGQQLWPLLEVAVESHELVRLFIKHGACVHSCTLRMIKARGGRRCERGLHMCICRGEYCCKDAPQANIESMRVLLDNGMYIDGTNSARETGLHVAAANGLEGAVEFLLRRGASPGRLDYEGYTPRKRAMENGYLHIVALFDKMYLDI